MGEGLSETARARKRRWSVAVLTLLACLVFAGCAQRSSDEERRPGGFYGGVSGGM